MMDNRGQYPEGITVYYHPNLEIRSYLTEEAISSLRVEHLKGPLTDETAKALNKLGLIGARVAKEILEIKGVSEIRMKPQEIWVKKTNSSSWDELERKILSIIGRALRRKKIRLVNRANQ
jgi:hypothetical protein